MHQAANDEDQALEISRLHRGVGIDRGGDVSKRGDQQSGEVGESVLIPEEEREVVQASQRANNDVGVSTAGSGDGRDVVLPEINHQYLDQDP